MNIIIWFSAQYFLPGVGGVDPREFDFEFINNVSMLEEEFVLLEKGIYIYILYKYRKQKDDRPLSNWTLSLVTHNLRLNTISTAYLACLLLIFTLA